MSTAPEEDFDGDVVVEVPNWVTHPGLTWLDDAACRFALADEAGSVEPKAIGKFFVAAGHVISPEQKQMCVTCPVRRECLIHSFIGNKGKMITAGYFAGFSSGQRKTIPFEQLYDAVDAESSRYRQDR